MTNLITKLLGGSPAPRTRVLVAGDEFGAPMSQSDVGAALLNRRNDPLYRALGQMAMALREQSVVAADNAAINGEGGQTNYQLGAGNACLTLAEMMQRLAEGKMPEGMKEWFYDSAGEGE